ncbi:pleckstrin homology domain-containing family G member 5-like [Sinocyclocheilus anshuiensis]|uniref:pleckstrin homology domain-containing family G member 5-like n=1 Tax=Sinocyclocheilus anshuiensis TaxID=1608454 RepID=UPI0007B9DA12|nr:PREDICTED: pleckstrin homology domain-containing family G member 5-like [Sinocyclocheilus anshuiensis]
MDTVKSSNPSKGPELSNVMAPEETAAGDKSDRQREEEKEADTDTPDGFVAVPSGAQRRAQEKHRYNTVGYQKKKQRAAVDFSTVSKGTSAGVKSRGALKQALFSQGVSDKNGTFEERSGGVQGQVDTLKQVLDLFNIPEDLRWTWGEGGTEKALEKSWTDIVDSHESMSKTQRHQQEALWELIYTELTYINKLTIATDLVMAALSHCHRYGFLQEVSPTMLFSNLPSILDAHQLFWHEVMYPMLQEVRLTGRPFDPLRLEAGCLQFPDRFPAYFEYCLEEERNVEFTRRQLDTTPQFHTYLTWVENHPQCGRMRLGGMQAKPHQRITKYPLLLKAVQKTTEDQPTKNALERMLYSVNHFLESINGYLQLKEDTLALSVAAQRIEECKIEGLSEEIDKYVREFCCFDLMSPVRGVGPNVIRKQLMEETLKVRIRKDTKELVVLLFTDVLLMTKTQKKSDKLKVVRPPLPLERIHCIELKDGYSFVLVEVGDLGCAVSVNFLSTPSPDSCASWVSALRETQVALETLRKNETNKTLKTTSTTEFGGSERPPIQDKMSDKVIEDPYGQSVSDRSDSDFDPAELVRLYSFHRRKSETEMLMEEEQSKVQQLPEDSNSPLIGQSNDQSQSAHAPKTNSAGLKTEEGRKQLEEEEAPSKKISEMRVTWKRGRRSSVNSTDVTQQDLPVRSQSNGSYLLMPGGDVEKNSTSIQSLPSTSASNKSLITASSYGATAETGEPMHQDPDDDSEEIRRNYLYSQSGDDHGLLKESGRFSRKLKSPRLRRRRPNNLQPSVPSDISSTDVNGLELTLNANSSGNQRRGFNPCIKPQDSHRVLKLRSLKNNHGTVWNVPEKRLSPDPQTHSEPKQTRDGNVQMKPIKLKTQRSVSIPEISSSQSSLPPSHRRSPSPPPGLGPQLHPSPLQGLLQRAKERERGRGLGKREGKKKTLSLQNSPTVSASPSPSVSEGEREAEREESAVAGMISAHGWIEGNVDGSEDEMKESNNVLEGISVDWPGWCFDDEEVFDFEDFEDEDWFDKKLTTNEPSRSETKPSERPDETECSEV